MLPESCDESFASLGALELGACEGAKFVEVLRTEVGHLVLLPMRPQVLDGIEFWRVGRQEFELYAAAFALDVISHKAAAMGLQTIPNDEELAAGEMAPKIFEKGNGFGRADGAFDVYCRTGVLPLGAQVRTR